MSGYTATRILLVLFYCFLYWLPAWVFSIEALTLSVLMGINLGFICFICFSYEYFFSFILIALSVSDRKPVDSKLAELANIANAMQQHSELQSLVVFVSHNLKEMLGTRAPAIFVSTKLVKQSGKMSSTLTCLQKGELRVTDEQSLIKENHFGKNLFINHSVISRAEADPIAQALFVKFGAEIAVPVFNNRNIIGLILVAAKTEEEKFDSFDRELLVFVSSQMAVALQRIEFHEQEKAKTQALHSEKLNMMSNLSATIAHEMRTPLAGVRANISGVEGYLPSLLDAYDEAREIYPQKFSEIRADHRKMLLNTPHRIQSMVDQANTVIDLLLVNLQDKHLDKSKFTTNSMSECIHEVIDTYPFRQNEKGKVKLFMEEDFGYFGINTLMIYVLFNLLKNALYSLQAAQKGEIQIILRAGEEENYLIFNDTGTGISLDLQDKIFEGFFTTKTNGTGAGLCFCKRTMNSFDGDMKVESEQGEYAKFILTFPLSS